jgi:hypothetical protein
MEETLSELSFKDSCLTAVLKSSSVFISAYPGFLVFGKTFTRSYSEKSYFKFSPFELYKLYISIIQILNFFTEDNPKITKGLILERNKSYKILYFWTSSILIVNDKEEKFVSFGIETEESFSIKIKMTLYELHNFITALKSTIIISLCLPTFENELMIAASNLDLSLLKKMKNYSETKEFVKAFMKQNNKENEEVFKFIQLIHYYHDIILIVHKFSSMCEFEENIGEQILTAK